MIADLPEIQEAPDIPDVLCSMTHDEQYTEMIGLSNKEKYRRKSGYYLKAPVEPALIGVMWDEERAAEWLSRKI